MAPVVLWIAEIEKAFASASSESVDGGLSQRMFGTPLSVVMREHVEKLRAWARGRCVMAD